MHYSCTQSLFCQVLSDGLDLDEHNFRTGLIGTVYLNAIEPYSFPTHMLMRNS